MGRRPETTPGVRRARRPRRHHHLRICERCAPPQIQPPGRRRRATVQRGAVRRPLGSPCHSPRRHQTKTSLAAAKNECQLTDLVILETRCPPGSGSLAKQVKMTLGSSSNFGRGRKERGARLLVAGLAEVPRRSRRESPKTSRGARGASRSIYCRVAKFGNSVSCG